MSPSVVAVHSVLADPLVEHGDQLHRQGAEPGGAASQRGAPFGPGPIVPAEQRGPPCGDLLRAGTVDAQRDRLGEPGARRIAGNPTARCPPDRRTRGPAVVEPPRAQPRPAASILGGAGLGAPGS